MPVVYQVLPGDSTRDGNARRHDIGYNYRQGRDPPMTSSTTANGLVLALAAAAALIPVAVVAQTRDNDSYFVHRLSMRIDDLQSEIRSLGRAMDPKQLQNEDGDSRAAEADRYARLRPQLEKLKKEAREQERRLTSIGNRPAGIAGSMSNEQRDIEQRVAALERRLEDIKRQFDKLRQS
jgi:hypothetical protein